MRIGFLGLGNMGGAILSGILRADALPHDQIFIYDPAAGIADQYSGNEQIHFSASEKEAVEQSDIVLLCVKPQVCAAVLERVRGCWRQGQSLISIAAGWTFEKIKKNLPDLVGVLRVMPNTPALVGEGMTVLADNHTLCGEHFALARQIFDLLGRTEILPEKMLEAVTAISGSGPAYVFLFIEAMADAGVLQGLPRDVSYRLAAQTVLGAGKMVLDTGKHPAQLKDMVASPAGTTIEAVRALEKNGFRSAVLEAVVTCGHRAAELKG